MTDDEEALGLVLSCTVICPHCGHRAQENMPVAGHLHSLTCKGCGLVLTPGPGACCVFCSYGTWPCPPVQREKSACCGGS